MKKRAHFPKGMQREFLNKIKKENKLDWSKVASMSKINESTLTKSYYYEKCSLPYSLFKKLIAISKSDEKKVIKNYDIKIKDEIIVIGRKVAGEQKKEFSPVNISYNNSNLLLDTSLVKFSKEDYNKKLKLPTKINEELSEEIGMHLGDGFLSASRYDYRLKGNAKDEKEYYLEYIKPLFKNLYNLEIKPKDFPNCFGFELTSKGLWEFKTKILGIRAGDKKDIKIPEILKVNDEKILCAFIRGLFDTDGCVYFYSRHGLDRYYPVVTIALQSKNLITDVGEILTMLGFNPGVYTKGRYGCICLYGIKALLKYEKMIGWHSQKHLNKVKEWKSRHKGLNMAVVV